MTVAATSLENIAREVVWWESPEATLAKPNEFVARVMARGFWDDVQFVESVFGEEAFRAAIRHARPGVFDPASWHYWHLRLGIEPISNLPKRTFA
jgi:hypothetical protein